jgi:hypothetical protein
MGERTDACEARVEECKEVAERAALRGHKPIGATLAWGFASLKGWLEAAANPEGLVFGPIGKGTITARKTDQPQRHRHREGARLACRPLSDASWPTTRSDRLPDQRRRARSSNLQEGRSLASKQHNSVGAACASARCSGSPCGQWLSRK